MRTNIDIDDALLAAVMAETGLPTKKAAVEAGLRELLLAARRRRAVAELRGLGWEGDLDAIRRAWPPRAEA